MDPGILHQLRTNDAELTSLNLRSNCIGDEGAASLADALKTNTVLTSLDLSHSNIGDAGAVSLGDALKGNTVLTSLGLDHNTIGAEGAASLADALQENEVLTSLDLFYNDIGDEGTALLAGALKINKVLTSLKLGYNGFGDEGAISLAGALKINTVVTSLDLKTNDIGAKGAASLAGALKKNKRLTSLNLNSNEIGDKGAASLAGALKENEVLTSLDNGSRHDIGNEFCAALAGALKINKVLTSLKLHGNSIDDAGAVLLGGALTVNEWLTSLDLQVNDIGDQGATVLADALRQNTRLASLVLNSNRIGDKGAVSLADALQENEVLTSLDINGNEFGAEGAASLAGALKINKVLTSLDLGCNDIGVQGATVLADALRENTVLTSLVLDIDRNEFGAEGAASLAGALKINKVLTSLDLRYSPSIGTEGAALLADALKCSGSSVLHFKGFDLNKHCASMGLPSSLANASNDEILRFLRDQQASSRWNRCRLMLVGESNVGKTYLRHRLIRPECTLPPVDGPPRSTDGVDVEHFMLSVRPPTAPDSGAAAAASSASSASSATQLEQIRCSVWDFAGQTSYYASHHAFLAAECIYLVCFTTRELQLDWDTTTLAKQTKIGYWLNSIQSHAPGAHVLLVATQNDPRDAKVLGEQWQQSVCVGLQAQFPSLHFAGVVPVLAGDKTDLRVERILKGKIRDLLEHKLDQVHAAYPPAMLKLAEMLEQSCGHISVAPALGLVSASVSASASTAASASASSSAPAAASSSASAAASAASPVMVAGASSLSSSSLLRSGRALTLEEFDTVLKDAGLHPSTYRSLCLKVFSAAGLLLHFDTDALRGVVFPNSRRVAEQMALLLTENGDSQRMTDGGIVSIETLRLLWQRQPGASGASLPSSIAHPREHSGVEALIALISHFRIGIRLDATTFVIPSKLPCAGAVLSDVANFLSAQPIQEGSPDALPVTRLRFGFKSSSGAPLARCFLEWEGFFTRLQVSLHPLAQAYPSQIRHWKDGVHLLGRGWQLVLDGSNISENRIDVVLQGERSMLVPIFQLVQRAVDLLLRSSFAPAVDLSESGVTVSYRLQLVGDHVQPDLPLPPASPLRSIMGVAEARFCDDVYVPSQLSALASINELRMAHPQHEAKKRGPLVYVTEHRSMAGTRMDPHAMCEFPGQWHDAHEAHLLPIPAGAATAACGPASWLTPLMRLSFDATTLMSLPTCSPSTGQLSKQDHHAASATAMEDIDAAGHARKRPLSQGVACSASLLGPASSSTLATSNQDEHSRKLQKRQGAGAAAAAASSSAGAAWQQHGASAAAASLSSGPDSLVYPHASAAQRLYADWLSTFWSRRNLRSLELLQCRQLPLPFATHAWLCRNHRDIVDLMEGASQPEQIRNPLQLPQRWAALEWEPWTSEMVEGSSAAGASAASASSPGAAANAPSSSGSHFYAYRAPLPRTDPLHAMVRLAFKKSTLQPRFKVTRVFALRNDVTCSLATNYMKKLRYDSGQTFHNIQVKDWTSLPPSASPGDQQRYATLQRLLQMGSPALQPLDSVTGMAQVFHGCFAESGALTIANSGFVNKKLEDVGFFGSGIYASSMPDYAALYPTKLKRGATPNAQGEFSMVGALGILGKVRPIVHDQLDYPSGPICSFRGKSMNKGYHTHYVSVEASGSYEAFREGKSNERLRADELVFDQVPQLHPNLLIYFRRAGPESDSDDEVEDDPAVGEDADEGKEADKGEGEDGNEAAAAADHAASPSAPGASAASAPSSSSPLPDSLAALKPSKQKLGGTGGATLQEDPTSGGKFVLKYASSKPVAGADVSRAAIEFIANRVYARLGVLVPEMALYDPLTGLRVPDGSPAVFSSKALLLLVRYVPGLSVVQKYLDIPVAANGRSLALDNPAWQLRLKGDLSPRLQSVRSSATAGFVADCLLANWDVCGWLFDNLYVAPDARLWRLDQGGSCIYRAKGTLKGDKLFNATVTEIQSFRSQASNRNAHLLYAGISLAEVEKQVRDLRQHKEHILGLFPAGSALRRTMEGRLQYLLDGTWRSTWKDASVGSSGSAAKQ